MHVENVMGVFWEGVKMGRCEEVSPSALQPVLGEKNNEKTNGMCPYERVLCTGFNGVGT